MTASILSGRKVLPRSVAVLTTLVLALTGIQPAAAAPTVIATIPVGTYPNGLDINRITNRLYVANQQQATISVINTLTNAVVGSPIPVGNLPGAVTVNETTNRVYVVNANDDTVSVIDGGTNAVIGSPIPVTDPGGIVVNPVTNRVYVGNSNSNVIYMIDGNSNTLVGTPIVVGYNPTKLVYSRSQNRVYVRLTSVSIVVIDCNTNTVVDTIPIGNRSGSFALNESTNRIYDSDFFNNTVRVIDIATKAFIGSPIRIYTPGSNGYPLSLAVNEVTNRIYVTEFGSGSNGSFVYVIDGATNQLTGSPIQVGSYPAGVALNEDTNRIYVTHVLINIVSVIEDIVVRVDAPGLYNPANAAFLLRYTNSSGAPDNGFPFGPSNDTNFTPLSGDWNGDGVDTVGLYNKANSVWLLSDNNSTVTYEFPYGTAGQGLLPFVGDWDNDGKDTPGLFNPATGAWLLINVNASSVPQASFLYGQGAPNLIPIPGDWDGDGDDSPGVFNPANGAFILSNGLNTPAFTSFPYGDGSLKPVKGDFDANGTDTVGHWNPANGKWLLINQNASIAPQIVYTYGADVPSLVPLMGKWTSAATGGATGLGLTPEIAPTFAP